MKDEFQAQKDEMQMQEDEGAAMKKQRQAVILVLVAIFAMLVGIVIGRSASPTRNVVEASSSRTTVTTPAYIRGYPSSTEVYVSDSGHKIHLRNNCSGMKYYTTMTLGQADAKGYAYCKNCF